MTLSFLMAMAMSKMISSVRAGLSSIHLYNIYHYIKMLSRNVPNTGIYEKSEDERKFLPLIFMLP